MYSFKYHCVLLCNIDMSTLNFQKEVTQIITYYRKTYSLTIILSSYIYSDHSEKKRAAISTVCWKPNIILKEVIFQKNHCWKPNKYRKPGTLSDITRLVVGSPTINTGSPVHYYLIKQKIIVGSPTNKYRKPGILLSD